MSIALVPNIGFVAGGTINACRFVKQSTSASATVLQAGAGDQMMGVSAEALSPNAPIPGATMTYASGDVLQVHVAGDVCLLDCAAAVTAGDKLKSNASGQGVTTVTASDIYGAIALDTSAAAGKVRVRLVGPLKV